MLLIVTGVENCVVVQFWADVVIGGGAWANEAGEASSMVGIVSRRAEYRHDRIADIFVDISAMFYSRDGARQAFRSEVEALMK